MFVPNTTVYTVECPECHDVRQQVGYEPTTTIECLCLECYADIDQYVESGMCMRCWDRTHTHATCPTQVVSDDVLLDLPF